MLFFYSCPYGSWKVLARRRVAFSIGRTPLRSQQHNIQGCLCIQNCVEDSLSLLAYTSRNLDAKFMEERMETCTRPTKSPYKTLNMRCAPEVYASMAAAAKAEGMPISTWVRRIVVLALGARKRKSAA